MKSGAKAQGAWAGDLGVQERGGQPLYPLLISVEARLILYSQDLILHAVLSDEVYCQAAPFVRRSERYRLISPTTIWLSEHANGEWEAKEGSVRNWKEK